ncbi:MAG: hypothetical protein PF518_07060 [Spirochaetaceae bacterium]|jgi:hypothetical protein|nr:hypothetical protein [Spirochaetaceae bacterium]
MGIGEIIYSLLTLVLIFLIIFSPLLRKLIKSVDKSKKALDSSEDKIYESVDSHRVVQKILGNGERSQNISFTRQNSLMPDKEYQSEQKISVVEKLDKLSTLKRAVIWKEILDKPLGLWE